MLISNNLTQPLGPNPTGLIILDLAQAQTHGLGYVSNKKAPQGKVSNERKALESEKIFSKKSFDEL